MNVHDDIQAERTAQQAKWGVQDHPSGAEASYKWLADACRNACDENAEDDTLTWLHIAAEEFWEAFSEADPLKRRVELVQLAAVIVAAIESEDRRRHRGGAGPMKTASSDKLTFDKAGWLKLEIETETGPSDIYARLTPAQALKFARRLTAWAKGAK